MSDFFLNFNFPDHTNKLDHKKPIVLLGSCFSDEMHNRFSQNGYDVLSNSFGTIFNPIPIFKNIQNAINDCFEYEIFEDQNGYYAWNASHKIYADSSEKLQLKLKNEQNLLREYLQNSGALIVTLGTAFQYTLINEDFVVANCHKYPQKNFTKKISDLSLIQQEWDRTLTLIKKFNPILQIVFTISPVRHVKDGLIENNNSKARLREFINHNTNQNNISYFPAFEIVNDVLRDYRFYKMDRVHPNDEAVDYVWKKFEKYFFTESSISLGKRISKFHSNFNHRSINKSSQQEILRLEKLKSERAEIEKGFPYVKLLT